MMVIEQSPLEENSQDSQVSVAVGQENSAVDQQKQEDGVVSKQKLRDLVRAGQQGILSEEQQDILKESNRRVTRLKSLARVQSVLAYAQTLLAAEPKVWDANPWLLGTKQGVIDLRTGSLLPGRPNDSIRTVIPTAWKGLSEPAPRFEQFLRELFADRATEERDELIAFLQRVLGYGLTGIGARVFLQFHSEGEHSGKGTLLRALMYVLGSAVGAVPQDVLSADEQCATSDHAKSQMCNVQGKRIAWASELDAQECFSSKQIKLLTNSHEIVARNLYGRKYPFQPSHLLILLSQRKPEVDIADRAFWDYLCPIVFKQRFVRYPAYANEQLCSAYLVCALEAEASGILAWLVRGTLEWHRLGLAIPDAVRGARQEWRSGESGVHGFVYDCCTLDSKEQTSSGVLYRAYQAWAGENGLTPVGHKQFEMEVKEINGVSCQRTKIARIFQGITLQRPEVF